MTVETPNPQPGDMVEVSLAGEWIDDERGRGVYDPISGWRYDVPKEAAIKVLERADDPSKDPVGTVRRDPEFNEVVAKVSPSHEEGRPWHSFDGGSTVTDQRVTEWPVIGAVPGTPAAEAQSPKVGLGQILPDGYASWAEYHEKHPYQPPARRSVRVPNEPHGPDIQARRLMVDLVAVDRPDAAVNVAVTAGMDRDAAREYVATLMGDGARTEVDPVEADRMRDMGFDKQPAFKISDEDRALIHSVLDERGNEYVYGQDDGSWKLDSAALTDVVADIVYAAIKRDRERGDR